MLQTMEPDEKPFPRAERLADLSSRWSDVTEFSSDPATSFLAAAAFGAASGASMLEVWRTLPPSPTADDIFSDRDYEEFCCDLLTLVLLAPVKTSVHGPDGGYDLIYEQKFLGGQVAKTYGQCKRYRQTVPVTEVREFLGVVHTNYAVGYYFTSGSLTTKGMELLVENFNIDHNNLCYLIDGERHAESAVVLRRFTATASELPIGDVQAMRPLISKLHEELLAIIHQPPSGSARGQQGALW